jgi:hypothetical protein
MPEASVLVYRLGSLGDTIVALPAFHAVRRAFPQTRITLLTSKPVSSKAAAAEEGIAGILRNRLGGSFLQAFGMADDIELFGKGIGLATIVGAVRAVGAKGFIVAEGAWPAMVGELGPMLGFVLVGWRVLLAGKLLFLAIRQALARNTLPLILGGIALQGLVIGQTSQPTGLGFLVLAAGLMLAACNVPRFVAPDTFDLFRSEEEPSCARQ